MLKTLFITSRVALVRWIKYLNAAHDAKPLSTLDASSEAYCITQLWGFIVPLKDRASPSAMSQLGSKGRVCLLRQEQWVQLEHIWLEGEC